MKYPPVNKKLSSYWKCPPVWYRTIIELKLIFIESRSMGFVLYNALDYSNALIQFNMSFSVCNVNKALLSYTEHSQLTDLHNWKHSMLPNDVLFMCTEIDAYEIQAVLICTNFSLIWKISFFCQFCRCDKTVKFVQYLWAWVCYMIM